MNDMERAGGIGRHLSPFAVWGLSFGYAVGWGAFVMPGAALAAIAADAEVAIAGEAEASATQDHAEGLVDRFSFNAYADVETAYICRGYVWDTRPFSSQYAAVEVDLDPVGAIEPSIWTYSPMSSSGHSDAMTRYAYAEIDYLLRYYYDIDIADGWRLRNGVGRQWVTNPGFRGGRTLTDWQALQVLDTPWLTPYWRLRVICRPVDETYWALGVKRSFDILDDLSFTADFFGDVGDRRHFRNMYGGWADANRRSLSAGLHALNLVLRLDYRLFEHVGLFAFVGQFCVVDDDARDAVKAAQVPEARRDLTFGGAGVSVSF